MWIEDPNEIIEDSECHKYWYDEGADEEYWNALMSNEPLDEYGDDELE